MMFWVWVSVGLAGLALVTWSWLSLPEGTNMMPVPPTIELKIGPYRWMKHPMYAGNVMFVAGLGGLGGGIFTALAVGFTAKMLMQYWAGLEER